MNAYCQTPKKKTQKTQLGTTFSKWINYISSETPFARFCMASLHILMHSLTLMCPSSQTLSSLCFCSCLHNTVQTLIVSLLVVPSNGLRSSLFTPNHPTSAARWVFAKPGFSQVSPLLSFSPVPAQKTFFNIGTQLHSIEQSNRYLSYILSRFNSSVLCFGGCFYFWLYFWKCYKCSW